MNINNKIQGILLLLVYICLATALLTDSFVGELNLYNVVRSTSLFAIISIGVAIVIITGGIDLSIGSVIGLLGCLLVMSIGWFSQAIAWMNENLSWFNVSPQWSQPMALLFVLALSILIGLIHGLLITKLRLQPFIVTLCGLLIYRGLARGITGDRNLGFGGGDREGLRLLAQSRPCTVAFLLLLLGLALVCIAIWRLRLARPAAGEPSRSGNWFSLASGLTLVVIGLSRYSYGIKFSHVFDFHKNWLYQSLLWAQGVKVPAEGGAMPGTLMWCVGLLFVPVTIWFLVVIFRASPRRMLPPVLLLLMSCLLLFGAVQLVNMSNNQLLGMFGLESLPIVDESGITVGHTHRILPDRLRMISVFLTLGLFMAALAWLARRGQHEAGTAVRLPMLVAATTAVLWLLGNNALIDLENPPDWVERFGWILGSTQFAKIAVPTPFFVMLAIAGAAAVFLNQTIYGRYLFALGNNEEAARFSGIDTDKMKIVAYVLCAFCGGVGAILFALDGGSVQPPNHGSFYELYAIAAAVLGGCSLRGGEGSVLGVVIATAIMRVLYSAISHLGIPDMVEFAIIGGVILIGVIVDEIVRRMAARRLAIQHAADGGGEI